MDYEFVMCCVLADIEVASICVREINKLYPKSKINVIVPSSQLERFKDSFAKFGNIFIVDEDEVLPNFSELITEKYKWIKKQRIGWYKQQFLKFEFCKKSQNSQLVIWDADTVILKRIEFLDPFGRMYITPSQEFHKPYFEMFMNLLQMPIAKKVSFISQHLIVDVDILNEMINEIVRINSKQHWYEVVLDHLDTAEQSGFSEYETYAQYILNKHPARIAVIKRRWFRMGGSLSQYLPESMFLKLMRQIYDFVAIEKWDKGLKNFFFGVAGYIKDVVNK